MNFRVALVAAWIVASAIAVGCRREEPAPEPAATPALPKASSALDSEGQAQAPGRTVSMAAEAGCALCIYHMPESNRCELAVKIDDKPYLVTGVDMDSLGDAHAPDGLCNVARQVQLTGRIEGDRVVAEKIELQPN